MLHAKTLVVDDIGFVGTANMDNRSFRLNFELMAVIYGGPIVEELAGIFREDLERSREVTKKRLKKKHLFDRALEATARLFAPML
jgi:cardiolipin synthase